MGISPTQATHATHATTTGATASAGICNSGSSLSHSGFTANNQGTYDYKDLPNEVKTILEKNNNKITKFYLYSRAVKGF
jgi:hypothetical protein